MTLPGKIPLDLWSSDVYRNLALDLDLRKERYLLMLTDQGDEPPRQSVANYRGFIADGLDHHDGPGSTRLRQPPPDEWKTRVNATDRLLERAKKRTTKPETSMWTDDPVKRVVPVYRDYEESVHMTMARLTLLDRQQPGGAFVVPFPYAYDLTGQRLDAPAPAKVIVHTIHEFGIRRPKGDGRNEEENVLPRDVILDLVKQVGETKRVAQQDVDAIRTLLTEWLDALGDKEKHRPTEEQLKEVKNWLWYFNGGDTAAMYQAYGRDLAALVLKVHQEHLLDVAFGGPLQSLFYLLAWLADLAKVPFRDALVRFADYVSFDGTLARSAVTQGWIETHAAKGYRRPPDPAADTLSGDDVAFRILACEEVNTKRLCFRHGFDVTVPRGWVWPPCTKDAMYWWRAVLWKHCSKVLRLDDGGDFHVNDLLRFAMLHGLFGDRRHPRVPPYVAACIKASVLQFKFWIDEPGATGYKGGEMTFWSENHQIAFHTAQLLAGTLFRDDLFPHSGTDRHGQPVNGQEHERRGRARTERWLDRRLAYGFSEWNSPVYYEEDIVPLFNLVDFAPDERLRTKATMVLDGLCFDLARFTCRGSFGVTAGRTYFTSKAFGWQQKPGEMIELLFGTRGDHIGTEKAAVALCTSPSYEVPEAILAIGLDRVLTDRAEPFSDLTRVSLTFDDGKKVGIGVDTIDDVAFWWGLGAYFRPELRNSTRRIAEATPNLRKTLPMALLWRLDDALFDDMLGALGPHVKALILDTAALTVSTNVTRAGSLLNVAPFPLNLVGIATGVVSVSLTIQAAVNIISTVAKILMDGLDAAWRAITFQDPPKPEIPKSALQQVWESMLETFNSGNMLSTANLRTFCIGDAMLSSVQNHQPAGVSFQKQSWIATLGCDACVWTNAPITAASGGRLTHAGVAALKHAFLLQGGEAVVDILSALFPLADQDDIKGEGLFEWGGSICLPKIAQHDEAAIIAYDFGHEHGTFSKTPTHAWFPTACFDEVDPVPTDESWLPERSGGGTWAFGRKADGFVALYSARRVKWVRDRRFDGDPALPGGVIGTSPFTTTELRAEDGSNIWICAVGSRARYGSFDAFKRQVRATYLHISGVGSLNQLQCTFDMPQGVTADIGGYRLELFYDDDEARVNSRKLEWDKFPRYQNKYVSGKRPGRVDWMEKVYRIQHPQLGLWIEHDVATATRTLGPRQPRTLHRTDVTGRPVDRVVPPSPVRPTPVAPARVAVRVQVSRRRRFRLEG